MKFTQPQQTKILELAATIASQNLQGGYLQSRQDAVRCLYSAMQLVALAPLVLEAVETHPKLAHGNGKQMIDIAADYVLSRCNAELGKIHAEEQAELEKLMKDGTDDSDE